MEKNLHDMVLKLEQLGDMKLLCEDLSNAILRAERFIAMPALDDAKEVMQEVGDVLRRVEEMQLLPSGDENLLGQAH